MNSHFKIFLFLVLVIIFQASTISNYNQIEMYEEGFLGIENSKPFIFIGMKEILKSFEKKHTLNNNFESKKDDAKFIVSLFFAEAEVKVNKNKHFENSLFLYYNANNELTLDLYYKECEYSFVESSLLKYVDNSSDKIQ